MKTISTNTAGNYIIHGTAYEPDELDSLWHRAMGTASVEVIGQDGQALRDVAREAGLTVHCLINRLDDALLVSDDDGRVGILADANGPCVAWIIKASS